MPDLIGFGNFGNGLLSAGDFAPSRAAPVTPTWGAQGDITGPTQALPIQPPPQRASMGSFGNINYGLLNQPMQGLLYSPTQVQQQRVNQIDLAQLNARIAAEQAAARARALPIVSRPASIGPESIQETGEGAGTMPTDPNLQALMAQAAQQQARMGVQDPTMMQMTQQQAAQRIAAQNEGLQRLAQANAARQAQAAAAAQQQASQRQVLTDQRLSDQQHLLAQRQAVSQRQTDALQQQQAAQQQLIAQRQAELAALRAKPPAIQPQPVSTSSPVLRNMYTAVLGGRGAPR